MDNSQLTKKEFIAFLLLFAANIDANINTDEIEYISKHLPKSKFEDLYKLFKDCSDNNCIDLICDYTELYFRTKEEKEALLTEVAVLLILDDKLSAVESHFINVMRNILFEISE